MNKYQGLIEQIAELGLIKVQAWTQENNGNKNRTNWKMKRNYIVRNIITSMDYRVAYHP